MGSSQWALLSKQSATCIHGTYYSPLRGGPRAGGSEFHGLSYGPRHVGRWGWGRASGPPGWLPGTTTTRTRGCGGGGARLPSGPQEPGLGLGVGRPSPTAPSHALASPRPQGWPELPLLQATPSPGPIRGLMPNILRRVHIILLRAACRGRSRGQMEEII